MIYTVFFTDNKHSEAKARPKLTDAVFCKEVHTKHKNIKKTQNILLNIKIKKVFSYSNVLFLDLD